MICGEDISDTLAYVLEKDEPGLPLVSRDSNELMLVLQHIDSIISSMTRIYYCVIILVILMLYQIWVFNTYLEFLFERESDDTMVCGAVYGGGGGL